MNWDEKQARLQNPDTVISTEEALRREREIQKTSCPHHPLQCIPTPGVPFLFLEASDGDAPGTANSDLRFHILSQSPPQPLPDMFQLDPQLGALALSPNGKHELGLMEGGAGNAGEGASEL